MQATTHRGDASTDSLHHPRPPHAAISALVRTYLGPVGQVRSGSRAGENDLLRGAWFSSLSRVEIATGEIVTRTADQIVAAVFSTSSASPHLFGSNRERFEHDLRALPSRRLAGRTLRRADPRHRPGHLATCRRHLAALPMM